MVLLIKVRDYIQDKEPATYYAFLAAGELLRKSKYGGLSEDELAAYYKTRPIDERLEGSLEEACDVFLKLVSGDRFCRGFDVPLNDWASRSIKKTCRLARDLITWRAFSLWANRNHGELPTSAQFLGQITIPLRGKLDKVCRGCHERKHM